MSTIISNVFSINGVIDTKRSVFDNMQTMATAASSWITFDVNQGKWAVVINQAGSSIRSFDDSNIIGSINVRGTGIYELYNKVEMNYPNKDILDQTDVITFEIKPDKRFTNEIDNTLNFSTDCVNDPTQAAMLASRELKQSRIDKIVEFRTDFTSIGLKGGDLIDITNEAYGFTNKMFRVLSITEQDAEDGSIVLGITAFEYDSDVYNYSDLIRTDSKPTNNIVSSSSNLSLISSNNTATTNSMLDALLLPAGAALLASLLSRLASGIGGGSIPTFSTFTLTASPSEVETAFNAHAGITPFGSANWSGDGTSAVDLYFSIGSPIKTLVLFIQSPLASYSYQTKINGTVVTRTGFVAYAPSQVDLGIITPLGIQGINTATVDWQTSFSQIQLANVPAGNFIVRIKPLVTYDLNQEDTQIVFPYSYGVIPQGSGGGVTVTAWGFNV